MNERSGLWGTVVIGVSVIAAAFIVGNTFLQVRGMDNVVAVTGSSQRIIASDVVKWRASFSRSATPETLTEGYAKMKQDLAIVLNYLKQNGVQDSEITANPISVNPNYDNNGYAAKGGGSSIIGYTLSQDVVLESGDVERAAKAIQNSGAIINQGVIFSSQAPEYYYSKLAALKLDMLAEATKDAGARAGRIAESTGARLGKLRTASMGVFQITPVNSTDLSDYGNYDTTSLQKQITAIVRASFDVR